LEYRLLGRTEVATDSEVPLLGPMLFQVFINNLEKF